MLRYKLFKVKPDKLEKLKAWSEKLQARKEEVLATLEYENVSTETLVTFAVAEEWFCMGMQELSGEHRKADMTVELNKEHFAVLEDCLEGYKGSVLYSFTR